MDYVVQAEWQTYSWAYLETLKLCTGHSLDNNDAHGKSATLSLTIGKTYEDMGMVEKSIALFEDALALWKWDPNRNEKDLIGGFIVNEIIPSLRRT